MERCIQSLTRLPPGFVIGYCVIRGVVVCCFSPVVGLVVAALVVVVVVVVVCFVAGRPLGERIQT